MTRDRRSDRDQAEPPAGSGWRRLRRDGHGRRRTGAKQPNPGCDDRSKARLGRPMPARCPPECPDGASAKDAAAFNAHSPGGGGSGLAQHVFRSPARIPATESRTDGSVRRAAKRKTLYVIMRDVAQLGAGERRDGKP